MPDREKVIKGIECCLQGDCSDCYQDGPGFGIECRKSLRRDALALLKEQKPGWISTAERMPDADGKYLCVWLNKIIETGTFLNGHFRLCGENRDNLVSYWMPLPKPPKEVSNGE